MNVKAIAEGVDLTVQAAGAWVNFDGTPFLEDRDFVGEISLEGATGAGVISIEGSNDGGTTVDTLLTQNGAGPTKKALLTGYAQVRVNVTTPFTAGLGSAYANAGV